MPALCDRAACGAPGCSHGGPGATQGWAADPKAPGLGATSEPVNAHGAQVKPPETTTEREASHDVVEPQATFTAPFPGARGPRVSPGSQQASGAGFSWPRGPAPTQASQSCVGTRPLYPRGHGSPGRVGPRVGLSNTGVCVSNEPGVILLPGRQARQRGGGGRGRDHEERGSETHRLSRLGVCLGVPWRHVLPASKAYLSLRWPRPPRLGLP